MAKSIISIIVAASDNGVIGKMGKLPWHLPAEMAYFRQKTAGHPIIMGRKTYEESIGRILPKRTNIIITHDTKYKVEGAVTAHSLEQALEIAKKTPGNEEVFLIGGQSIYQQALEITDRIYLSVVHTQLEGDAFFDYPKTSWRIVSKEDHPADHENTYAFSFLVLEPKK